MGTPLTWTSEMSVGDQELDRQHQGLIEMIRTLEGAITPEAAGDKALEVLDKMMDYLKEHFDTEERKMAAHGYHGLEEHKLEHVDFILKTMDLYEEAGSGRKGLDRKIVIFLKEWLKGHIMGSDQAYAPFIRDSN